MSILCYYKKKITEEHGAIALATLAFLAGFFSVALVTLWTFSQVMGAASYLQATAQTAAYAAVNRVDADSGSDAIDCLDASGNSTNTYDEYYLCTAGRALETAQTVFAVSLEGQPFGLCYQADPTSPSPCAGDAVTLVARSGDQSSPIGEVSIKAFEITTRRARGCKVDDSRIDGDRGTIDPPPSEPPGSQPLTPEEKACWVLRDERFVAGQSRFLRVKGLNNTTPGVIIRAQAEIRPPLLGLFTTIEIEASAVALRGGAAPPTTPGGY